MRMRRTLVANMVITVEPGLYFVYALLGPALADPKISRFIDTNVLVRYKSLMGGKKTF